MLLIKQFFEVSLLTLCFTTIVRAQAVFEPEIICADTCAIDFSLFSLEVQPVIPFSDNALQNTNLTGSFLDEYPEIRPDILSALSFYPELENARIWFTFKPIRQTMNSRPSPGNIFRKKANRHYIIIVNNNKGKHKGLPYNELSFNIKTGWLGHELAHICEYETMSNWQTFWFAVKYISSDKFIRKVERFTDLITIKHGLAYPLYVGTGFLLQSKGIDPKYRKNTITYSLSQSEIKCLWCKSQEGKSLLTGSNPDQK